MSEPEKMFVAYRTGRGTISIVPRTTGGWRAFIVWMLMIAPMTALFAWFAGTEPEGVALWFGLAAYAALIILWAICMVRWMLARSDRVDMDEFYAFKRHKEEEKKRRGDPR